jgi:hypothetical protein
LEVRLALLFVGCICRFYQWADIVHAGWLAATSFGIGQAVSGKMQFGGRGLLEPVLVRAGFARGAYSKVQAPWQWCRSDVRMTFLGLGFQPAIS